MKKFIYPYFLIAFFAIFFTLPSKTFSQTPAPCYPDLDTCLWTTPTPAPLLIYLPNCGPGCYIFVTYTYRTCGTLQDLQILDMQCPWGSCTCAADVLLKEVTKALIIANPMNFNPQNNTTGCSTNWRVSKGSCFAEFKVVVYTGGTHADTTRIIRPCTGTPCCLQRIEVCRWDRSPTDSVVIRQLGPASPGSSSVRCDTAHVVGGPTGTTCRNFCDSLGANFKNVENGPGGDVVKGNIPELKKSLLGESIFAPNPVTGNSSSFKISTPETGILYIELYDQAGRRVFNKTVMTSIGLQNFDLDFSELTSGQYHYVLRFDGADLHTGNVSVIK